MALSRILKYIYQNASDEVIRRGKKIFHTAGAQLTENDPLTESATFRVKNDVYYNQYRVKIEHYGFSEGHQISTRCNCPYNMGTVCKHEAAALFQLNDLIESGFFDNVDVAFDQKDTTARMRQITEHFLKLFAGSGNFNSARTLNEERKVKIVSAAKEVVQANVKESGKEFHVVLKQNEERYFDTSCDCEETQHPLCRHKTAVFLQLLKKGGPNYFASIRDWDAQKDRLLSLYGYSLKDDLTDKFDFTFHDGKLVMRVLDRSIKKLDAPEKINLHDNKKEEEESNLRHGVLVETNTHSFPFTTFQVISGEPNEKLTELDAKLKRCAIDKAIPTNETNHRERELIAAVRKLDSMDELVRHVKRESPFGDFLDFIPQKLKEQRPQDDLRKQVWDFFLPRYHSLFDQFKDYPFLYRLPTGETFSKKNFKHIKFSSEQFSLGITINKRAEGNVLLKKNYRIGEQTLAPSKVQIINDGLILIDEILHAADVTETISMMEYFDVHQQKTISWKKWTEDLETILLPLSGHVWIDMDEQLKVHLPGVEPELKLSLQETDKFLSLKPIFVYDQLERGWMDQRPVIHAKEGLLHIQERDMAAEQTFLNILRYIHPEVRESRKSGSFLVPVEDALKGDWYFHFKEEIGKTKAEILGFENLRELKISPFKPKARLQISTGIDWFDVEVNLTFGEERVSMADLKKAISRNQNYVTLSDGSRGLLTEDWRKKYSLMIQMGNLEGPNSLRLKKMHFSALDGVEEDIDKEDVQSQMAERQARILSFDFQNPEKVGVPQNVNATLRNYQVAGIQWINFLHQTGWGGILADDMGLGKTLQSLTYLQYRLNEEPGSMFLVVCPTTLLYNWENEIGKFTPDITYKIHHGSDREQDEQKLAQDCHLIITTYGTLRSDIKLLSQIRFDFVVLDESQAIKNPLSQIARAVLLLNSRNRLALSGTPVQNNTFDLFSQMNFLNPGLLGSMEFFRSHFAVPIDKMQDKEARENLKKLINPFLLRRTKEQVAPDLPEKTESTIYCEMEDEQKKIYHEFRNAFRTRILGEIEEKGLARSQMSVLTGLMKLRQICDSPAILKGEDLENYSIKVKELVRELSENTGEHKALVFSQFLGMLGLIRKEMDRLHIPYVYFDGSSSTKEREKAVQNFQNDKDCRVFLISLKAGGVGLNLTAADYVYLVDPWWNPTVEQQAIDRTHRIGQTKKIFAYRLICKGTIEEKILLLQERKMALARDLIADENAFVKRLSKDDIAYLLS